MPSSQLLNSYSRALIGGAVNRGYSLPTIYRAIELPLQPITKSVDELPTPKANFEAFRHLAETSNASYTEIDENTEVDSVKFTHIQRNLKWLTQDELWGLVPTPIPPALFMVMSDLVIMSLTLGDALKRAFRLYAYVTDDISLSLTQAGPIVEVYVDLKHPEWDPSRFLQEWWLLKWYHFICWLVGDKIPIRNIEFQHAPNAPLGEYNRAYMSECKFEQKRAYFSFSSNWLEKHCIRAIDDFRMASLNFKVFDIFTIRGIENPLKPRMETLLENHFHLHRMFPSMNEIANQYHMSTQTLRRKLAAEESSYSEIKENVRRKAALDWLTNPDLTISQIARLSGFSETNGLARAVKHWTGMSPKEYRNKNK